MKRKNENALSFDKTAMKIVYVYSISLILQGNSLFTQAFQTGANIKVTESNLPFTARSFTRSYHRSRLSFSLGKEWYNSNDDDDEDDDDSDIDLSDQDWRAFRAKLVMQPTSNPTTDEPNDINDDEIMDLDGIGAAFSQTDESSSTSDSLSGLKLSPLDPSQWAYDSGKVIETGAVILGGVEQDFGFGLRQQYFHKTVILVIDHNENQFTKGIILNRPTDMLLVDENEMEEDKKRKWRVWFGGDVQGWDSFMPEIVCLHSLQGPEIEKVSTQVMKDMQYTTFDDAKKLVKDGLAAPSDFWVFCGYAGWGPQQLMGELERKSWYMVATDSQTLLKELARQSADAEPREAGLDTWELLMNMIGRGEMVEDTKGDFDDLMLKEWAREKLLSDNLDDEMGMSGEGIFSTTELIDVDPVDRLVQRVNAAKRGEDARVGTIVRASSKERSPFLLSKQEYHKSLILIISDDDTVTVGVMLNHAAAKGLEMQIEDKKTKQKKKVTLPLRFGGEYAVKGQNPSLWLHCNSNLRNAEIGSPIGDVDLKNGVWKCTQEQVVAAIGQGLATPEDFMVVSGVSVWTKGEKGSARGIQGEIRNGNFEIVETDKVESVWEILMKQELLTAWSLAKNLSLMKEAWSTGGAEEEESIGDKSEEIMNGLGEGYDEEDDSLVFRTDIKVADLSDDALRSWVATFLLGSSVLS